LRRPSFPRDRTRSDITPVGSPNATGWATFRRSVFRNSTRTSGTNTAYLLQASSNNAHGNNIYLLAPHGDLYADAGGTSAGGLYAYDGGSEFGTTPRKQRESGRSTQFRVYQSPSLLTNAQPP
jgi:hypothetical protein